MKNKIIIAALLLIMIIGCSQTPVQAPVQSGNSPVMQYWINRGKAEANQKAISEKVAAEKTDNRTPRRLSDLETIKI